MHGARHYDFRRGEQLEHDDHLIEWKKPRKPDWMDQPTYEALPETMTMREVRIRVNRPGFRTRQLVVVTSLFDAEEFTKDDLADLYRARWYAELDLLSLKATMQMDVLRGKTPEIVRKELWTHLLAYNLIRTVMAQAAVEHDLPPRTISFKGTLQTLQAFQPLLRTACVDQLSKLYQDLLAAVVEHRVGHRPDRHEPRARKRRPKPYPLLTQPRHKARKAICQNN